MIFGSSCFHEVFSDPPKMNSSSLYHFSKFLSLLYFSAACFARPVVQLICKSDSCLLKWMCNVLKFHTLHFVVLMRFVAGQSGDCSYALLTLPATANLTSINKLTPSKQNIPTPTPSSLLGISIGSIDPTLVEHFSRFACNILFARCQNISTLTTVYHVSPFLTIHDHFSPRFSSIYHR